jgi:O-antigen/teichoic acid export membrane protein
LLAQLVGSSVLGQYFLVVATLNLISILADFGIGSGIVRYEREYNNGKFLTSGLILRLPIIVFVSLLILLADGWIETYFGFKFGIPLVTIFVVNQFNGVFTHTLIAENKVGISGWIESIITISRISVQIGLVLVWPTAVSLIADHVISLLMSLVMTLKLLESRPSLPSVEQIRSLLSFGKRDYLSGIESFSGEWIDSLLIGVFLSPSAVGVYEIAWSISRKIYIGSEAIGKAFYPRIIQAESSDDGVERLRTQALTFFPLLIFPGAIGFIIVGKDILSLYGPEFVTGYVVTIVLIVGRVFQGIDSIYKSSFRAASIPWARSKFSPLIVFMNVALNLALIPEFGIVGAGLATALSFGVAPILGVRVFGFGYKSVLPKWGLQLIASVLMGGYVSVLNFILPDGVIMLVVEITVGIITYSIFLYIIDQNIIRTIFNELSTELSADPD